MSIRQRVTIRAKFGRLRLDGLPAEREPQSVARVFFSVQSLERIKQAALECRVYTGA